MQNMDNEDEYASPYQIISTVLPQLQDFRPKWGPAPRAEHGHGPFCHNDAKTHRCSELKRITHIIQHVLDNGQYKMTSRKTKASIQQSLAQGTPSVVLAMGNVAQTLEPLRNATTNSQPAGGSGVPTMMDNFDAQRTQALDPKK